MSKPFVPNEVIQLPCGVSEMSLSQGKVAIFDTSDYVFIQGLRWCAWKNPRSHVWYAVSSYGPKRNRKTVRMHSMIVPNVGLLDHKDGDGLNNRRVNLRPASVSLNAFNRKCVPHSSHYHGVHWSKQAQRWLAGIVVDGRRVHVGSFKHEDAAYAARLAAEKTYYSGFERTPR